ncbi:LCP family protein [Acidiferrimicrobium sp. IK]|uniref:LCP family protein n=1 Tax=Acidiferrimicrobium sp. IK TaxID=2871700 RepID=UPI0021CB2F25|nr:LCP family protein [Acidiferrimicrobium sp. IK]MCU4185007.1 LCP family protein [Acidiferrimicrobium sp. IK]
MPDQYPARHSSSRRRAADKRLPPVGVVRRWPRRILISVNVVVALSIIAAGSAFGYIHWRLGQIKTVSIPSLSGKHTSTSKPFTLLVVGSDTRNLANGAAYGGTTGPNGTQGQRSDTIMLVRVVPATRTLSIMSIPRDLYVHVQGMGMQKINAAFDSGANLLVSTIESQVGIPIDHYVEVNFDSFQQITDAVGGVSVYFPTPARDGEESDFHIPNAGCVNLTGNLALDFARSRFYEYYLNGSWHTQPSSDLARIQRQQFFVKKMISKAKSQFTNPIALNDIIGGVTKNLKVDSGMSTSALLELAKTFRSVDVAGIKTATLATTPAVVGGQDILQFQQPEAGQQIAAFNSLGDTAGAAPATTTTIPQPATPVTPSSVSIEVANGSGVSEQATKTGAALSQLGYHTTVLAQAAPSTSTTEVLYAPDSLAAGQQVARQISGAVTLQVDNALTSSPYNLEVITGTSFAGIAGTTSTTTPSTAAPTTPTTAPPAPTYLLPPHPPLTSVPAC